MIYVISDIPKRPLTQSQNPKRKNYIDRLGDYLLRLCCKRKKELEEEVWINRIRSI